MKCLARIIAIFVVSTIPSLARIPPATTPSVGHTRHSRRTLERQRRVITDRTDAPPVPVTITGRSSAAGKILAHSSASTPALQPVVTLADVRAT